MRERELKKVIDKVEEIRVKNINIFLVIYYNIYILKIVYILLIILRILQILILIYKLTYY